VAPPAQRKPKGKTAAGHAQQASLEVKVSPWGQVFIDGELVGATPIKPTVLSSGIHSVIVVNPALGARRNFTVELKPGERRELKVILQP
jgi:eukaryotic-like serine/threonine-protein kinase